MAKSRKQTTQKPRTAKSRAAECKSAAECRRLMRIAIDNAMDATGVFEDSRPKIDEILECFDIRVAELA